MRIGLAFDLVPVNIGAIDGPDDRYEEYDKPETVEALAGILRGEGHEVVLLGDGRELVAKVLADPPDLVWNLAEGEGTGRCREARVPALLEMLGIACTGSDPLTMAAALDKGVAKRLVRAVGVAVPDGLEIAPSTPPDDCEARLSEFAAKVALPWILKPAFEGSSKGIRARCLVDSGAEALEVLGSLAADYQQPILVEEFIAGDEVTVGLIGEGSGTDVIGTMRVIPREAVARFVYSIEIKRHWAEKVHYEVPASLADPVMSRLIRAAHDAYNALGCRDVARIDFRVREGVPVFLEANPLPGLAPGWSDLVIMARGMGMSHADLIRRILDAALDRIGRPGTTTTGRPR